MLVRLGFGYVLDVLHLEVVAFVLAWRTALVAGIDVVDDHVRRSDVHVQVDVDVRRGVRVAALEERGKKLVRAFTTGLDVQTRRTVIVAHISPCR